MGNTNHKYNNLDNKEIIKEWEVKINDKITSMLSHMDLERKNIHLMSHEIELMLDCLEFVETIDKNLNPSTKKIMAVDMIVKMKELMFPEKKANMYDIDLTVDLLYKVNSGIYSIKKTTSRKYCFSL